MAKQETQGLKLPPVMRFIDKTLLKFLLMLLTGMTASESETKETEFA